MRPHKRSVRFLSAAEDDLVEIIMFMAEDDAVAADRLAERIEKQLARLADHPALGRIPAEQDLARLGYRYLVVDNYLIFYTVGSDTVLIHRIIHGARDYAGLLR
jgi:toxin ParE1/3/4